MDFKTWLGVPFEEGARDHIASADGREGLGSVGSLQLPDNTLNFAKKHPLMDDKVSARPLLVKKSINFTQIAVDRVSAIDHRRYDVLFIGTAEGWLYKAVSLGSEVHVIEELQLFEEPQPVESLSISHKEDGFKVQARAKFEQSPITKSDKAKLKNVTVVVGSDLVLPCQLISNLARPLWLFNDLQLVPGRGVRVESRLGALVIEGAGAGEAGRYTCLSQERGERFLAERYVVSVVASAPVFMEARAPDGSLGLLVPGRGVRVESRLGALVIEGAGAGEAGRYTCLSQERGERFLAERYVVSVVASAPVFMEARAPDGSLGLVWVLVITLASACLLLLGSVLYLRRRLKQGKDSELMKPLESTLVYPVSLPREPTHFVRSKGSDSELWDTGNYYYSDGSLKIVPGHAPCPSAAPGSGIPGQPLPSTAALHSPNRLSLGSIRGSGSNGYIRLNLTSTGEERAEFSAPFTEELRKTLQQRSVLPDTNPEESSV
ncbi:UNVERIFIED_CONTAM: hypothetical protein FKN15_009839 [Acipenser sinensis]